MYRLAILSLVMFFALWASQMTEWSPKDYRYGNFLALDSFFTAPAENPIKSLIFTGDVLLARNVERLSLAHGEDYPFHRINFASSSAVLANFEATVPPVHKPTKDFNFTFSVPTTSLTALREAGITHTTLANNHSYDFGLAGFENTISALSEAGLTAWGDQSNKATTSLEVIKVGDEELAIIALYAVEQAPSSQDLDEVFSLASSSDKQIIFVHWGTEYTKTPSTFQKKLATDLVIRGADFIIGHHPHVVQSVDLIDGVPVFYSLGNFIFDQYFDSEVQSGLLVEYTKTDNNDYLRLIPTTSLDLRSAPRHMSVAEKAEFLNGLSTYSDPALASEIMAGTIILNRD